MTYSVFIKLYESTVEPILFYGSGIWGTKQNSVINKVQNKAGKLCLAVGKRTSNVNKSDTVSCHPFQCLEAQFDTIVISLSPSVRFNLLISRMHESLCLLQHVINRRSIECTDVVNNTHITVKTVMRLIKDKIMEHDNDEFATELFNDRNQPNGNKLRTYRLSQ
jgi:hypothetical protein